MSRTVYTPESLPISIERQEELAEGWRDLQSEKMAFGEIEGESLDDRCQKILQELPEDSSKKDQIIALYLILNDGEYMIAPRTVADIIGCSRSYAQGFNYVIEEKIVVEGREVSPNLKDYVISEDGNECVKCGSNTSLEIHHIIPYIDGGDDSFQNLVTLCKDCHLKAHGGDRGGVNYDSRDEFWNWVDN